MRSKEINGYKVKLVSELSIRTRHRICVYEKTFIIKRFDLWYWKLVHTSKVVFKDHTTMKDSILLDWYNRMVYEYEYHKTSWEEYKKRKRY